MMQRLSLLVVFALFCSLFISTIYALGPIPDHLKDILVTVTDSTADQLESGTWFIDLYAPWCGHCKQVFPTIVQFAEKVKNDPQQFPDTKIALVDGTENPALNARFIAGGYPSLSVYKDSVKSVYRAPRTLDSIAKHVKLMAHPSVSLLTGRSALKRAEGTNGYWENLFVYIGLNLNTHGEFMKCADKFQGRARFYSPWGPADQQSRALAESVWRNHEGDLDKQFELLPDSQVKGFKELLDHYKLSEEDLPIVINQPVGRIPHLYTGPWLSNSPNLDEGLCLWIENLLDLPVQQLVPSIFDTVINKSDVYLLMSVQDQTVEKMAQLAMLPVISEQYSMWFDYIVWTHGSSIPKLKSKFLIPSNRDDFIIIINRDLKKYYITYDLHEDHLLPWIKDITNGKEEGLRLYHWADFITPLSRDIMKYTERFSPDHLLFFLMLGCGMFFIGGIIGLIYVCYCMEDVQVKIARIKEERAVMQRQLDNQTTRVQNDNNKPTNVIASKVHQDQDVQRRK